MLLKSDKVCFVHSFSCGWHQQERLQENKTKRVLKIIIINKYKIIALILMLASILFLAGCLENETEVTPEISPTVISPAPSPISPFVSRLQGTDVNGNSLDVDEYELKILVDFRSVNSNWYQFGYNIYDSKNGSFRGLKLSDRIFDKNDAGRREYVFNIRNDFPGFVWGVNDTIKIVFKLADANNSEIMIENVTYVNNLPSSPVPKYPMNNKYAVVSSKLEVNPAYDPDGDNIIYHFLVDDRNDSTPGIVDYPYTFEGWSENTSVNLKSIEDGHSYDWIATASDGKRESRESETWKFTTVPYLNSVGIEFSNEAWKRVQTFKDPVDGIFEVFYGVNRLYAENRLNIMFNVTSIKKIDQNSDPENVVDYIHGRCNQRQKDYQLFNVFIYVSKDSGWYTGGLCPAIGLRYEDNWSLFSYGGIRAFSHELGHFRGVQDFYRMDVPGSKNNVSRLQHKSSMRQICRGDVPSDEIMQSPYELDTCFSEYSRYVINKYANETLTNFAARMFTEVPAKNYIKLVDQNNKPISSALIKVYTNTYNPLDFDSMIDDIPEVTGATDADGRFLFASRQPNGPLDLKFDVLHISATSNDITKYAWIEIIELNKAFRKGKNESYDYVLNYDQLLREGND